MPERTVTPLTCAVVPNTRGFRSRSGDCGRSVEWAARTLSIMPIEVPPELGVDVAEAERDAEAAFRVACWCESNDDRHRANAWFKHAARLGGGAMIFRISEYYWVDAKHDDANRVRLWWERLLDVTFPRLDAPEIYVQPRMFSPIELDGRTGYGMNSSIKIRSMQPEKAAQALSAAQDRFLLVLDDGRELDTDDELLEARQSGEGGTWPYSASGSSPAMDSGDGPVTVIDMDSNQYPRMVMTMINIVIDELLAHDVSAATLAPGD